MPIQYQLLSFFLIKPQTFTGKQFRVTISSWEIEDNPGISFPLPMIALEIRTRHNFNELDKRGHLLGASGQGFQTPKKDHIQEDIVSFPSMNAIVSVNDAWSYKSFSDIRGAGLRSKLTMAGQKNPGYEIKEFNHQMNHPASGFLLKGDNNAFSLNDKREAVGSSCHCICWVLVHLPFTCQCLIRRWNNWSGYRNVLVYGSLPSRRLLGSINS